MTINQLTAGEAIDRNRLNQMINAINKLEDSANLGALVRKGSTYEDKDDRIGIQAFETVASGLATGNNFLKLGSLTFPKAFTAPPIVVGSAEGPKIFYNLYWEGVTASGINYVSIYAPITGNTFPSIIKCNWIAIGPWNG